MPSQTLAAHLAAAAPTISSPPHFLAVVWSYLTSLAASAIDTPAERTAVEDAVMRAYDALTAGFAKASPILALAFGAFRQTVKDFLDRMLLAIAPPPPPTPAPAAVPAPQGSAP